MKKTPEYQLKAVKDYRERSNLKQYNRGVPPEFIPILDEKLAELRKNYKQPKKQDKKP